MSKTTNKYSPEVRERSVRLVLDNQGQQSSRWQAIMSISVKIGCSAHTLNEWVKKAERHRTVINIFAQAANQLSQPDFTK
ncbi:hypothetical protein CLV74_103320 [Donghicola tyrosinivorans]|uniref:Transposase n=1 Tax=Donghicola tyrosinivorans TaxID=1652492 RepID=A0A2T0WYH0_9RHOB|nr:hypothetical protein CLV74_103320 [Donghicola tyrosinivorans]